MSWMSGILISIYIQLLYAIPFVLFCHVNNLISFAFDKDSARIESSGH